MGLATFSLFSLGNNEVIRFPVIFILPCCFPLLYNTPAIQETQPLVLDENFTNSDQEYPLSLKLNIYIYYSDGKLTNTPLCSYLEFCLVCQANSDTPLLYCYKIMEVIYLSFNTYCLLHFDLIQ